MTTPAGSDEIEQFEVGSLPTIGPERRNWHPVLQELVRSSLALIFAALLGLTIVWAFLETGKSDLRWSHTKELLEVILPAETALLGSAVGFYFGSRKP